MTTIPAVSPTELIRSSWGNTVATELNSKTVKTDGSMPMTGTLTINASPGLRLRRSGDSPFLQFENTTGATRFGYIQGTAARMTYQIDTAAGFHQFVVNGATAPSEVGRFDSTGLDVNGAVTATGRVTGSDAMFGKTATNLAASGVEIPAGTLEGSIRSTIAANTVNVYYRHEAAADVAGMGFAQFARGGGLVIGGISQVGTTGVAYNTTSDRRAKTITGPLVDAVERLLALRPYRVTWNGDPGRGTCDALIADEAQAVVPDAVAGDPGAVYTEAEAAAVGVDAGAAKHQQLDYSKLIPLTIAAVQELAMRVEALEA